ncbi:MAG: ExbD/TolR family protein [Zoogloeaceae bacterium]|jgi:biopolymer transport protein TolR|nr:ExbD/TolR family protein [Zoogloeaceae bacterium]
MRPRRLKNEINVVPYIDVMLVLLVIFMVAAPMLQTGSVDLPTVEKSNIAPQDPLRIEVGASGELTIVDEAGARAVNKAELPGFLAVAQEKIPQPAVLVAGDKAASYESVLTVLDEIKKLGFDRVGLETARK